MNSNITNMTNSLRIDLLSAIASKPSCMTAAVDARLEQLSTDAVTELTLSDARAIVAASPTLAAADRSGATASQVLLAIIAAEA